MTPMLVLLALSVNGPAFQASLDALRKDQDIPGVAAVVSCRDEVLFAGASGMADLESGTAMSADTIMYAGSLTKVLTTALVLHLEASGMLSLHDAVEGIAVESGEEITIAQLLTHSSGLDREGDFGYWFTAQFPRAEDLERHLQTARLRFRPGEKVHYSNIGYGALGRVVEQASGRSYAEALRTFILDPLGMTASGAPGPAAGVSRGYTPIGRLLPNEERPFGGIGAKVGARHLREYHDAAALTPAFGAFTTARDLGRFARFLLGYRAKGAIDSPLPMSQASARALGLGGGYYQGRPIARHGGWFAAHKSEILLDLQGHVGVVVMANSDNAVPADIAKALLLPALDGCQPDEALH